MLQGIKLGAKNNIVVNSPVPRAQGVRNTHSLVDKEA